MATSSFSSRLIPALVLFLCLNQSSSAQNAEIGGSVVDSSRAAIQKATVAFVNAGTGNEIRLQTNNDGFYRATSIAPGVYRVAVSAAGFQQQAVENLKVDVGGKMTLDFVMKVGEQSSTVTVEAAGLQINTTDASLSTVVDHEFVEKIPLNGRSFQSLLTLIPGVLAVPSSGAGSSGQIAVNGMRSESNYFVLDGVSANTGVNSDSPGRGAGYSGSVSSGTALGTTQSLVSIDALQEFRGTTSTYSAEFGRVPGGQFSFTTRSGSNELHGSLYNYFRNNVLDANDFFNNRNRVRQPALRQNDFGGTVGGPVVLPHLYNGRDKTFFFFSYEGLRLVSPQAAQVVSVPSTRLRTDPALAPAVLRPILNAFPLPNGSGTSAEVEDPISHFSPFTAAYSNPSNIDSSSLRVDHAFSDKLRLFGRGAYVPSVTQTRYSGDLAQLNTNHVDSKTMTLGATYMLSSSSTNETRFNMNWNDQISSSAIDNFGGAAPFSITDIPGLSQNDWALFSYRVGSPLIGFWLNPQNNRQKQYNIVDNFTSIIGRHNVKFGVDYRQLQTNSSLPGFYESPFYYSYAQLFANSPQLFTNYRSQGNMAPLYKNLSLFAQDEWKVSDRLNLSFGLRWDVNPAPRDANGNQPYTIDQITNLATTKVAPQGTALWNTTYANFAPRFGLAYQLHQKAGYQTVVRAGAGLFYDASSVQASQGYWYGIGITGTLNANNRPFPFTAAQLQATPAPSAVPTAGGSNNIYAFDPNLKQPFSTQWNVAVEQGLGASQTLSLAYVGSMGDRLLTSRQLYPERFGNPQFPGAGAAYLYVTLNGSSSTYNALQAQFQRRLSHGFQLLSSYTWSHAIDDSTTNFTLTTLQRTSSDFDVRHNFQAALTYSIPGTYSNRLISSLFSHWSLDSRISSRSALPVDVLASTQVNASGASFSPHPNYDATKPLYVNSDNAPGGRAINANAFALLPNGAEGNSGRNIARGFASAQADFALRRDFSLTERIHLNFRAEAFNALNHANFGAISNNIQTSTAARPFGWATGTQAGQLGGLNPLYQVGGPRSLQLALKAQF